MSDDAHINILDALAGWSDYVYRLAESNLNTGKSVSSLIDIGDAVFDLYQEAGAMIEPSHNEIETFVKDRVMSVIMMEEIDPDAADVCIDCNRDDIGRIVSACKKHTIIKFGE